MKKAILSIFTLGFSIFSLQGQEVSNSWGSYSVDSMLLDFTIPDLPAFKALGTDPSNLLRPSDIQKFAIAFDPFLEGSNAVIPSNFAVDFAPWKLLSKDWTVSQYRTDFAKRVAYNSSFSLGSAKDADTGNSKVAVGYRLKLAGKNADLLNSDYLDQIYDAQRMENDLQVFAFDLWNSWKEVSPRTISNEQLEEREKYFKENLVLFMFLKKKELSLIEYLESNSLQKEFDDYKTFTHTTTQGLIDAFNKSAWNAARTDLAVAVVGESPDSLVENIAYSSLSFWLTQSIGIGKKGQLLLGGNLLLPDNADAIFTLNSRFYLGNDKFRFYGEYQYKNENELGEASSLVNLGTELSLLKDFWVQFYAGVEDVYGEADVSQFVSSLSLKYSFNQSSK